MYKNKTDIDLIIRKIIELYDDSVDIKVFKVSSYYFIVIGSNFIYLKDLNIQSEEDINLVAQEIMYRIGLNNENNFNIKCSR